MENECAICFNNLTDEIAILKCNHKFHFKCITRWMKKKNNFVKFCPFCPDTENEIINIINPICVEKTSNQVHYNFGVCLKF